MYTLYSGMEVGWGWCGVCSALTGTEHMYVPLCASQCSNLLGVSISSFVPWYVV